MTDQEKQLLLQIAVVKKCDWHEFESKADPMCRFCLQESLIHVLNKLAKINDELEAKKSQVTSTGIGSKNLKN